jgi:small subunit ribosomal protein S1
VGLGDIVEAVVLTLDKNNQKLSLGLKQLQPDPWKDIEEEFPIGSVVKGKIKSFAAFGAFVELKEGVDGLIHISDMSWTRKVNHPGEILKRNENVDVKVLGIDRDKRRMSLGIKQLQENPWPGLAEEFPVGKELEASISRILDRGLIVEVKPDVEGFIPLAQMGREIKKPSEVFTVGEKINAEVIEFDADDKRILLSVKEYYKDKDEQEWNAHCEKYPVRDAKPAEKQTPADAGSESDADQAPDAAQQSAPPAEAATSQQAEPSSDDEDAQQQDEKDTTQQ